MMMETKGKRRGDRAVMMCDVTDRLPNPAVLTVATLVKLLVLMWLIYSLQLSSSFFYSIVLRQLNRGRAEGGDRERERVRMTCRNRGCCGKDQAPTHDAAPGEPPG